MFFFLNRVKRCVLIRSQYVSIYLLYLWYFLVQVKTSSIHNILSRIFICQRSPLLNNLHISIYVDYTIQRTMMASYLDYFHNTTTLVLNIHTSHIIMHLCYVCVLRSVQKHIFRTKWDFSGHLSLKIS